ncbi:MAG: hypothetical protein BJ554DRAFT_3508 [Olpidium bornovanus]|uniref:Uncharacterized protein n=1 Tax=Olpidium bornovanus TaxID=278681 RepID=A0A8H8DG65_9FUNG|nr:MAG: hypothetical protein BJ554DRAFT_3508 [Olpidium bornovanus]
MLGRRLVMRRREQEQRTPGLGAERRLFARGLHAADVDHVARARDGKKAGGQVTLRRRASTPLILRTTERRSASAVGSRRQAVGIGGWQPAAGDRREPGHALIQSQQRQAAGGGGGGGGALTEDPAETAQALRRPRAAGDGGGWSRGRRAVPSDWNQEQLRLLKHSERPAVGLSGGAAAHLEKAAAGLLLHGFYGTAGTPCLCRARRKFMKHRRAVKRLRGGPPRRKAAGGYLGALWRWGAGPSGPHEERYADAADANDPRNGCCWSWTAHNILENRDM